MGRGGVDAGIAALYEGHSRCGVLPVQWISLTFFPLIILALWHFIISLSCIPPMAYWIVLRLFDWSIHCSAPCFAVCRKINLAHPGGIVCPWFSYATWTRSYTSHHDFRNILLFVSRRFITPFQCQHQNPFKAHQYLPAVESRVLRCQLCNR